MRPANGGKAGQDIKVTYGREAAREAEGPPEKKPLHSKIQK